MVEYAMQHASEVGEGLEVLAGVRELLEALAPRDEVVVGLVCLALQFMPLCEAPIIFAQYFLTEMKKR